MKTLLILVTGVLLLTGCKSENKSAESSKENIDVAVVQEPQEFGAGVKAAEVVGAEKMAAAFEGLDANDTLVTAFEAKVVEVCQMKGCWMKLDLGNDKTAMVRFKDYGFFVPKDLAGKSVTVEGKAFLDIMSVEDQKHYAEDKGASAEEIQKIESPKQTYSFEATGVQLK